MTQGLDSNSPQKHAVPQPQTEDSASVSAAEIGVPKTGANRILVIQAVLTVSVAVFAYFYNAQLLDVVPAALWGGGIAMLNVWLADRRIRKAAEERIIGQEVSAFYIGAVERFISTLILFVVGMFVIKLMPLPLLGAFAAAQAGYLFGQGRQA